MPQSLLLSGKDGVGLSTIARYIAELSKAVPTVILPEKDEKIDLEKGVISVDIMRQLYNDTKTKNIEKKEVNRPNEWYGSRDKNFASNVAFAAVNQAYDKHRRRPSEATGQYGEN